jgi:hypothetical protein
MKKTLTVALSLMLAGATYAQADVVKAQEVPKTDKVVMPAEVKPMDPRQGGRPAGSMDPGQNGRPGMPEGRPGRPNGIPEGRPGMEPRQGGRRPGEMDPRAGSRPDGRPNMDPMARAKQAVDQLNAKVKLTPEQMPKAMDAFMKFQTAKMNIMHGVPKNAATPEQINQLKAAKEERKAQIDAILTPAQKAMRKDANGRGDKRDGGKPEDDDNDDNQGGRSGEGRGHDMEHKGHEMEGRGRDMEHKGRDMEGRGKEMRDKMNRENKQEGNKKEKKGDD